MLEYRDGINADRYASDFAYEKKAVLRRDGPQDQARSGRRLGRRGS